MKVVDLFSGVGGLSLGAVRSGFDLVGAVEIDPRILASHKVNFPSVTHVAKDVTRLNAQSLESAVRMKADDLAGLIGGPPCQGFSSIGRRNLKDARNFMFIDFFRLVNELRPAFYLAENVPGILQPQYSKVRQSAIKKVEKNYQILEPLKIVAKDFGAPTIRTRIFFIGVRNDIKGFDRLLTNIEKSKCTNPTVVKEALAGLPFNISDRWLSFEDSWRTCDISRSNSYVRSLNKLVDGVGEKESIHKFVKEKKVSGCFGTHHTVEVVKRFEKLKPGEQDSISKAVRLRPDGFCPTLRAGTDSSKGSYQAVRPIHHIKPRVITPREAARLQGFPDWFQFDETKWHSFRQIGNSVCPIVAEKILSAIRSSLSM